MTTSKKKAKVGYVKGVVAPDQEGYLDILQLPVDIENKQTNLRQVIKDLLQLQVSLESVSTRIEQYKSDLKDFLTTKGYEVHTDSLKGLLIQLKSIEVLNPKDKHQIALLEDDYITDVIDVNLKQIIKNAEIPEDLKEGYYKIQDGKIVLDPLRREELEGAE